MIFKAFVCFDEEGFIKSMCKYRDCDNPVCDEYVVKLTKIKKNVLNEELMNVKDTLHEINKNFERLNKKLGRRI